MRALSQGFILTLSHLIPSLSREKGEDKSLSQFILLGLDQA